MSVNETEMNPKNTEAALFRCAVNHTYSSKCCPRFGFARRFAMVLRTLLSGRTTMTGTGEWLKQYLIQDKHNVLA